jgi:hypothetical protein
LENRILIKISKFMIELPETLRPARFDEVPKNSSALERLKQIKCAKIIE